MIWWPWLLLAFAFGFAAAVRFAGEEMQAREERINRLRALLCETEGELLQTRLMLNGKIDKAHTEAEHEELPDRSDPDWWRKA